MSVNEQLAEELHKTVIEKFKRRKVYVGFKDNIWAADLDEMGCASSRYTIQRFTIERSNAWFMQKLCKHAFVLYRHKSW